MFFLGINNENNDKPNAAQRELKLIQCRYDLLMPKENINYVALNN